MVWYGTGDARRPLCILRGIMSLYETLQIEYFVFGGASQVLWEVIKNSYTF